MIRSFRGLFALLNRSLQTEDRLVRTHLFRFLFLLLSYLMMWGVQSNRFWMSAPGLQLFQSMSYLNFTCITLAALSFFATAITEEKEDMTLGLLKMADVSPLALLIGKSTPRLITALVLLTAQLPFTMLAVTLGGVSINQVLAAYCCLFAYLVFCAYMGLFYSVIATRSRVAGFLSGLTLFVYFFGPVFYMIIKQSAQFYGSWPDGSWLDIGLSNSFMWLSSTSAFNRVMSILGPASIGFAEPIFSTQVISNLVTAGVFLLLAWILFEPCTANEKPAAESRGLLYQRLGAKAKLFGAGRAWRNALAWKDYNFIGGGLTMFAVKIVLYASIMGLMVWFNSGWNRNFGLEDFGQIAMGVATFALVVEAGVQASRVFYSETKWNTLSSIVLLPHSIAAIAYSKVFGAALALLPVLGLLVLGIVCAPESFADFVENALDEPGFWYFFSQIILGIHLTAVFSLYLKWGALPVALAAVIGGNMMLSFFLMLIFMGTSGPNSGEGLLVLGALVSLAFCIVIHFWVGQRLEHIAAS